MSELLLKMENINKRFPGVNALKDVNFELKAGEVHGLIGENGAGKSTLMSVLGGIYKPDSGKIFVDGRELEFSSASDSQNSGIAFIHQEISLEPYMTVAENIYLGREPKNRLNLIDADEMNRNAKKYLNQIQLDISPTIKVAKLSIAQQQMVEIAQALSLKAKILIMDEATSSLTENEVKILFDTIRRLAGQGVGIIYISHKMDEFFTITDRITVMRNGSVIGTVDSSETSNDALVHMMIGRDIKDYYVYTQHELGETTLEVKNLCTAALLKDVSFHVRKGEIVGFYGLLGAGRTEIMHCIMGLDPMESGEIYVNGEKMEKLSPAICQKHGIVMIPENRRSEGLIVSNTVSFNITLPVLKDFMDCLKVNRGKEKKIIQSAVNNLSIKTPSVQQLVRNLSGGNQQKVVIGKWLATNPKILILDEPTRGIDVGAKSEIYKIINDLASEGLSVIFVSSELPEIINMADRIVDMYEGKITKIFEKKDFSQEQIMLYAMGGNVNG